MRPLLSAYAPGWHASQSPFEAKHNALDADVLEVVTSDQDAPSSYPAPPGWCKQWRPTRVPVGHGIRVDLDEHGAPMGLEISVPSAVTAPELNALLVQHGVATLDAEEWAPLAA
jgi:hypothetical protein